MLALLNYFKKLFNLTSHKESIVLPDAESFDNDTLTQQVVMPPQTIEQNRVLEQKVTLPKKIKPLEHLIQSLAEKQYNNLDQARIADVAMKNATYYGDIEVISFLIENKYPVNWQYKNGWTPLMYACNAGQIQAAQFLIENGADINIQSASGLTALMLACKIGNAKIVKFLIKECNANPFLKDNKKLTALDFASQSYNPNKDDIITTLNNAIAKHQYKAEQEIEELEVIEVRKYSDDSKQNIIKAWAAHTDVSNQDTPLLSRDQSDDILDFSQDALLIGQS